MDERLHPKIRMINSSKIKKMKVNTHSRMGQSTVASGRATFGMASGSSHGRMEHAMRANGKIIRLMVVEYFIT